MSTDSHICAQHGGHNEVRSASCPAHMSIQPHMCSRSHCVPLAMSIKVIVKERCAKVFDICILQNSSPELLIRVKHAEQKLPIN